jgi:hypothetical protein
MNTEKHVCPNCGYKEPDQLAIPISIPEMAQIDTENFYPIVIDQNGFMLSSFAHLGVKHKKAPSKGTLLARKFGNRTKTKPKK